MSNKFLSKTVSAVSSIALAASMLAMPLVSHAATAGGVYSTPDGTVWFVAQDMQRRPFTSAGAFQSYGFLSFAQVVPADASVTVLPAGSFIPPRDGSIFCSTSTKGTDVAGECALITGGMKAAFTSAAVFGGLGYSFANAQYGDSSFLSKTANIDNSSSAHSPGVLVNNGGTVQMVVTGGLWGVPSVDVFNSWFANFGFSQVVPANAADKAMTQIGVIPARVAGQLNPSGITSSPPPVSVGDCNLDGNAGDITVTSSSLFSSEEVGEGEEDQGVIAFEAEADDDSDVAITSVKVELLHDVGAGGSDDLEDYADEVKVWYAGEEVGSADVDTFNETSNVFTKSISLDCAEISAGETGELSVSVTGANTIDSTDLLDANNDWDVDITSVRFEDGDGVTTTVDTDGLTLDQTFEFVDFATASDVELNVALTDDMDEVNDSHNIIVDEDDTTNDEPILAFSLEASGDSDIWVDEIPVLITSTDTDVDGVGTDAAALSTVINKADLYHGTSLVDSKSVSGAGLFQTILFDDLDTTIDAGDTEDFTVKVKALGLTGNYAEGTTLKGELTATETNNIDAEDEEGDAVSDTDATGTALGDFHSLFSDGIVVTVNSAETNVIVNDTAFDDGVEFVWDLTIENVGDDDVFFNRTQGNTFIRQTDAADPSTDMIFAFDDGAGTLGSFSATITDSGATEVDGGGDFAAQDFYRLGSGESESFTITVTAINSLGSAQMRAWLTNIQWTIDDVTSFVGTETINDYTANLVEDSETPFKLVN